MHGNVWEWCQDHWHDNYEGAPTDGSAWIEGGNSSDGSNAAAPGPLSEGLPFRVPRSDAGPGDDSYNRFSGCVCGPQDSSAAHRLTLALYPFALLLLSENKLLPVGALAPRILGPASFITAPIKMGEPFTSRQAAPVTPPGI
jgi:hypothetical protein